MELENTKVITQDDIKVFTFRSEVFILDNEHQNLRHANFEKCLINCEPVVPVHGYSGLIGCATLHVEGKSVFAEFFLDYNTPERLDIETKTTLLYPHLHGHYNTRPVHGGKEMATKYVVNNLILNKNKDIDPRVGPV